MQAHPEQQSGGGELHYIAREQDIAAVMPVGNMPGQQDEEDAGRNRARPV